jgi:GNAT superfamily N-acetyltransferase
MQSTSCSSWFVLQLLPEIGRRGQIAIGAYADEELIGAAFANLLAKPLVGTLQSVFVSAAHRGRGVAQALIGGLERHVSSRGVRRIEAMYAGTAPSAPTIAHILAKAGWKAPNPPTLILGGSVRIAEAAWTRHVPAGYEIFPWSELSAAETAQLATPHGTAPWYPPPLGPFPDEPVEPLCSVGVRHAGQVVGWMLTHRVDHERVRYSRLFVRQEHRARFSGLALIAEAIRRQRAAQIPKCLCAISTGNGAMMRILRRRLAPYIESRTELCCAYKDLTE